jgi:hypothetical protein
MTAVEGAAIHMTGSAFVNESTDSSAAGGLAALQVVFEGGAGHWANFEVAGEDRGCTDEGFDSNFVLDCLVVGGEQDAWLRLIDVFDNSPGDVPEALYVHELHLAAGSKLDLNGLALYYDGEFVDMGCDITGGQPVPEPAGAGLLLAGTLALLRRRRRRA